MEKHASLSIGKRVLSFCMALCLILTMLPASALSVRADDSTTIYLVPSSNWKADNARFAVFYFNDDTQASGWGDMTDSNGDGIYEGTLPSGYPKLLFARMNPGTAENSWNNKWNQTADLAAPTDSKTCHTVDENVWDYGIGSWSCLHGAEYQTTSTSAPTCKEPGSTTVTCACGEVMSATTTPATGEHSYVDGVCTGCGESEPVVETWTEVDTAQELINALAEGGKVRLANNIDLYETAYIKNDLTLDLNRCIITGLTGTTEYGDPTYGDIHINNPGTKITVVITDSSGDPGGYVYDPDGDQNGIYVYTDTDLTIEEGHFGFIYVGDEVDGLFTVANGTDVWDWEILSGTFNFDPSTFVTAEETVTNNGNGTWTVSATESGDSGDEEEPEDTWVEVDTEDELIDALAKGGKVKLTGDIDLLTEIVVMKDTQLDLNGHTLCMDYYETETDWYCGEIEIGEYDGTPAVSMTILDSSAAGTGEVTMHPWAYEIYVNSGSSLTVEDCDIAYISAGGSLTLNGGTIGEVLIYEDAVVSLKDATVEKWDIWGGNFDFDPSDHLYADYEAVENDDGTYDVTYIGVTETGETYTVYFYNYYDSYDEYYIGAYDETTGEEDYTQSSDIMYVEYYDYNKNGSLQFPMTKVSEDGKYWSIQLDTGYQNVPISFGLDRHSTYNTPAPTEGGMMYKPGTDEWVEYDGSSDSEPEDTWVEVDTEDELIYALGAGAKVKLTGDIDLLSQVVVTKDTQLDLNGHTLCMDYYETETDISTGIIMVGDFTGTSTPSMTILDSSAAGTGKMTQDLFAMGPYVLSGASLTLESGEITQITTLGSLNLNGGSVGKVDTNFSTVVILDDTTVEAWSIMGGTFNFDPSDHLYADYEAVENDDGTYDVTYIGVTETGETYTVYFYNYYDSYDEYYFGMYDETTGEEDYTQSSDIMYVEYYDYNKNGSLQFPMAKVSEDGKYWSIQLDTGYQNVPISFGSGSISTIKTPAPTEGGMMYKPGTDEWVEYDGPSDSEPEDPSVTVYYDNSTSKWSAVYAYAWDTNGNAGSWPGSAMTKVEGEENVYAITFDKAYANIIFNNGNNGSQTADLTFPADDKVLYDGSAWKTYAPPVKLYMVPNANWKADNARFAMYYFNNATGTNGWVNLTDEDKDGTYEVIVPNGYTDIIFCRMNPSETGNDWTKVWNQTSDLTVPTDGTNCYTLNADGWNGAGSWTTYTPEEDDSTTECEVILHFQDSLNWGNVNLYSWYKVNGSDTTLTSGWPGDSVALDEDGFHTATYTAELPAGATLYYIFNNGTAQTVDMPVDSEDVADGKVELWIVPGSTVDGKYNCEVYGNPDAIVISPVVDGMGVTFKYADADAASVEVFGSWNNWASGLDMARNSAGVWTADLTLENYGDYQYKFVVDGSTWIADPANSWTSSPDGNSMFRISNPDAEDTNTITINVYYDRADGIYETEEGNWNIYAWGDGMGGTQFDFEEDDSGKMVTTIEVNGRTSTYVNMKPRMTSAAVEWVQQESEISVNLSSIVAGSIDVYITSAGTGGNSGATTVTQQQGTDVVFMNKVTNVQLDYDNGTIAIATQSAAQANMFELAHFDSDGNETVVAGTSVTGSGTVYTMAMPEGWQWDLTTLYQYKIHFLQAKEGDTDHDYYDIGIDTVYSSTKFNSQFTYTGSDLGFTYSTNATTFKVWAPTAEEVTLRLYATGSDKETGAAALGSHSMTKGTKGEWSVTVAGDLQGVYYTYEVTVNGETVEACDPYARTTGVNGERAMVVNLSATAPADGWTYGSSTSSYTDAIIYELHVRDFSIDDSSGVSAANRGKFTAFTETNSAAMQHLTNLGITHLHLLPIYDYGSVDETTCNTFNWGYDPVNYNVPEGSYSTNPYDGATRVKEMKEMVDSLHEQGINVVMDVVYNHVYNADKFCFNKIVPGYFSRSNSNTSGCGNDTASERTMVRKYIVDSVTYLAQEYKLDGFRFDLVGLIDTVTINQVVTAVHNINPNAIFYGEGWEMDSTNTDYDIDMAKQGNASKTPNFAYFSDSMRNLLGGNNGRSLGFVSGLSGQEESLRNNFMGNPGWTTNPAQVVQYASCHDNYTLIDKLVLSTGKTAMDSDIIRMNNLAAAIYMTSQGISFIHAGEDFLREKITETGGRAENSYNSSDFVNHIEWSNLSKSEYADTSAYYKGLIAFRKAHPILRNNSSTTYQWISSNVVQFTVTGNNETILLVFNGNNASQALTLPSGNWDVYIDGEDAGTTKLSTVSGTVSMAPISALVMIKSSSTAATEHTFGNTWSFSATQHWKECTCCTGTKQVTGLADHNFINGSCECGAKLADLVTGWTLPGTFNNWAGAPMSYTTSTNEVSVTLELEAKSYEFKVRNGDSWFSTTTSITDSASGVSMSTSVGDNAKLSITEAGSYTFSYVISTGKLSVEKAIEKINLSGTAMTLGNSLSLDFGINTALLENNGEGHYAVITRHYSDGTADDVVTVQRSDWAAYSGTVLTASYTGLAAKEMCDSVDIVVYNADGKAVSNKYSDSIRGYAMRMLNNSNNQNKAELLTVLVDMLNYGTAAQQFFTHNINDLANKDLTDAQKAYATASIAPENNRVEGTGYAGTALTLKSRILLDFVFYDDVIGTDYTGMYAIATYTNHYGEEKSVTINDFAVYASGYHYVSVSGMSVADCGQLVTCTVYDSQDNVIASATDSAEGYVARQIAKSTDTDIYTSIIKFADSAYNFFH